MELSLSMAAGVAIEVLGPGTTVSEMVRLHGSDRSLVARAALRGGTSVIVKLHDPQGGGSSAVREPAGLEVAGRPRLLGVSTSPPGLVMQDLGTGESLSEALLGSDAALARSRVHAWASALARTHIRGDGFAGGLQRHAERLGTPVPAVDGMPGLLSATAEALDAVLSPWGIHPSEQSMQELRGLNDMLGRDLHRLSPTDTCPDNCQWVDGAYVLLDYESAQVRHVAWDVAYLQVPFPTCWCSWALPTDVAKTALVTWKQVFDSRYVETPAFDEDLRVARLGWAFVTGWWYLRRAIDLQDENDPEYPQPRLQTRLLQRFGDAPRVKRAPALTELAREVHRQMISRWPARPLDLAPAFRHQVANEPRFKDSERAVGPERA